MDEYESDADRKDKNDLMQYLINRVADAKIEAEVRSMVDQFDSPKFPAMPDDALGRSPVLGRKSPRSLGVVPPGFVGHSRVGQPTTSNEKRHRWNATSEWMCMPRAARWQ